MGFNDVIGRLFGKKRGPQVASKGRGEASRRYVAPKDLARQEKFRQAASQHSGVLSEEFARTLEESDQGLIFPESPQDVLEYLGNIEPLGLSEEEKSVVREWTRDIVTDRGEHAVWNSRLRLKLELRYLTSEAGLQKGSLYMPDDVG